MVEELHPFEQTLEAVREHFPNALMSNISLKEIGIVLKLHPDLDLSSINLHPGIIIPTPVIYLPRPLNGFTRAFDQEGEQRLIGLGLLDRLAEEQRNTLAKLATLPEIDGLTWRIPTFGLLARILENYRIENNEFLLKREYVWTEDITESVRHPLVHLIAGYFGTDGLGISYMLGGFEGSVGIFPVGLPAELEPVHLHLVQ